LRINLFVSKNRIFRADKRPNYFQYADLAGLERTEDEPVPTLRHGRELMNYLEMDKICPQLNQAYNSNWSRSNVLVRAGKPLDLTDSIHGQLGKFAMGPSRGHGLIAQ
jgi:hypothetical protein